MGTPEFPEEHGYWRAKAEAHHRSDKRAMPVMAPDLCSEKNLFKKMTDEGCGVMQRRIPLQPSERQI